MGFSYTGQEGKLMLVDTTTKDELLPGLPLLSIKVSFPFELVKREYLGQKGPDYREFAQGYELEIESEPDDASTLAAYLKLIQAKAEGQINDEFVAIMSVSSIDSTVFQVTMFDVHWESLPLELGGQAAALKLTLKGKGKSYKVQVV